MASTLLEQTRAKHEEIELLERVIVKELQKSVQGHKERLLQSHRVKGFVDGVAEAAESLVEIYEDKDNLRKDEIATLGGQSGQNVFSTFYDHLKEIREYHRRHPDTIISDSTDETEALLSQEPWVEFSGEEGFGRYFDLHELYNTYISSKFGSHVEYSTYVDQFLATDKLSLRHKFTQEYKEYIHSLLAYLTSFHARTQPLQPVAKILKKADDEFEQAWKEGKVPGWQGFAAQESEPKQTVVNLEDFDTVEELLDKDLVPPQKLKQALAELGLKTGGIPEERAQRLLLAKHTPISQMEARHLSKARAKQLSDRGPGEEEARQVALTEWRAARVGALLAPVTAETRAQLEKKAAMTLEEMEAEKEAEEAAGGPEAGEAESSDEEGEVYNPLKLPMGWDGKPIPYWLYKLHGLGQEFKCEICGNYSYWGRRAFERHFKEARHQHGMRCLGIPNTKNFNEVTVIQEAEELWEKIKEKVGETKWKPDVEEEYEDKDGNVYNKKTFTDLKRQGLL